ncbi:MAG: hypothetical protein PVG63_04095, partial [Anaerolineales bacterium]
MSMRISREWLWVGILAVFAALVSYAPILVADHLAPQGKVFSGFLLNPIDGHTYLAKMHQGLEGSWKFQLDYTPQPGQGVFLYPFYIALGHLAREFGIKLLDLFHSVRLIAMACMFILSYLFFKRFISYRPARWLAFGLTLVGGGQGWIGLLFGIEGSDLLIPESVPFLAGYVNAHFPVAISLMLLSAILILMDGGRLAWRISGAAACGAALALVLPFSCFSLLLALGTWIIWEGLLGWREAGWRGWIKQYQPKLSTAIALALGMAPVLLYDLWVVGQHPVISEWTLQNLTPSPPVSSYIFGYGVILLLAVASLKAVLTEGQARHRFLAAWMITGLISLYLPIGLQRRLNLGLFYPMAALAVLAWEKWFSGRRWGRVLAVLILVLSVPSNLLVIGAGLASVVSGQHLVTYDAAEQEAYAWLSNNLPSDVVVLASPEVGNRLPAFTAARVLYGHPFETPRADFQLELVESLWRYQGSPSDGIAELLGHDVKYVFYGPLEREIGVPTWLSLLEPIYQGSG